MGPNEMTSLCNASTVKENLNKCTVGILEYWQLSEYIINYWFPWISMNSTDSFVKELQQSMHHVVTLDSELKKVILKYNTCDYELFEYGLQHFKEQQLHIIASSGSPMLLGIRKPPENKHLPEFTFRAGSI